MRTTPFWLDECPRPADLQTASHAPEAVDVAIVGGGYTGLSAAAALAELGASVAVLERHEIGWGASSRNAGMALCGFQRGMRQVFARFGETLARAFWQASLDAVALVDQVHIEEGLPIERTGELQLAARPSHADEQERQAEWFGSVLGHPVRFVRRADLTSEIGTEAFYGGLLDPLGCGIQPARFLYALARRAARRGAVLVEHAGVEDVGRHGDGFTVRTTAGMVKAREVLGATSGYTDRLIAGLKRRILPIGSYIIVTEPLPLDVARRISPTRRMMYDTRHLLNYFRRLPDGRLLWGGRNNLTPDLDLQQSAATLRRSMLGVFPDLEPFAVTYSWTGCIDVSWDRMPHLGEHHGVRYVLGFGGHGVALSAYLGREVALRLSGRKTRSPFEEIPHPALPGYRGRAWFLSAIAAYYRVRDAIA